MTRWVAQTRPNYVSMTPYNVSDDRILGVQSTHQPAIWMGESGPVVVVAGVGDVGAQAGEGGRGLRMLRETETVGADWYEVVGETEEGARVKIEMTAS